MKLKIEVLNAALCLSSRVYSATSPADMGKVMGAATKKLSGKADGKTISALVKELLNK